ncbi:phosphatidylinositol-glycan-specific phospholipase, partial [Acrasis kona]
WVYLLLAFVVHTNACGIATHIEISNRALTWFRDTKHAAILERNLGALQAGSPFPDWGYSCGNMGEESEAAHWPPFINAFAKHIRASYKQPYTQEQEKVVSFLFGMTSHYMADVLWHGLADVENGFINVDAALNFHGDYSSAHSNCDTALVSIF